MILFYPTNSMHLPVISIPPIAVNDILPRGNQLKTNFQVDATANFWTVNGQGEIQQWGSINNSITGGSIILTGGGSGSAFCSNSGLPTFYCGKAPSATGISYYNTANNWVNIPTSVKLSNNGGNRNHQYYMATGIDSIFRPRLNKVIYYFDGINLTTVESLSNGRFFSVADIAVDALGRAWAFTGDSL